MKTEKLIESLLKNYELDTTSEGLQDTPARVKKSFDELLSGYKIDPKSVFKKFDSGKYAGTITVQKITFSSLCEHHLLPFFGSVDISYTPNGKILGLSKFARVVEIFSRRLQLQERLTQEIAQCIKDNLNPVNCTVTIRAKHLCMAIRGVNKINSSTITTYTI